ncbi:MAG TPA: DUF5627 domain-containing protein [Bacteroidales bacterium]|nr:DUF5627 domain-containing protein [Bacteroidales bacterium]HOK98781.1 DUF5627 domain-containing protein [Bacteroidales bacterium]HPO65698.1 DUF5627 domain-containing protein [Bacteroidales bacterium]
MRNKWFITITALVLLVVVACENEKWEFPDYKYTAVYFSYQTPVKTLELGDDDMYDNSKDNEHVIQIFATMGGVYENKQDRIIQVEIDNSLCDSLYFDSETGAPVLPLPSSYYQLPAKMEIVIPKGKLMGAIEFKLTDAFFQDSLALNRNYVLPLVMKSVLGADSILRGKSEKANPDRRIASDWITVPKDYILFAVKYINPWHAFYLRRGMTVVKGKNGNSNLDTTMIYRAKYVELNEVCQAISSSYNSVVINLITKAADGKTDLPFTLNLTFNDNNECTITHPANATYTITGTGRFVKGGDEWGGIRRNVMYLNYNIEFSNATYSFTDTLVVRDRGIKFETFSAVVKQ